MLLDQDEASRLVEATRWIVLGDAETQGPGTSGRATQRSVRSRSPSLGTLRLSLATCLEGLPRRRRRSAQSRQRLAPAEVEVLTAMGGYRQWNERPTSQGGSEMTQAHHRSKGLLLPQLRRLLRVLEARRAALRCAGES